MRFAQQSCTAFLVLWLVFLAPQQGQAATPATPMPAVGDGFSAASAQGQALLQWVVAQPEVQTRFAGARTLLLRMGTDRPKGPAGPYRRATLLFRNYDKGIVHRVQVELDTGEIAIDDVTSLVQPSREEIRTAWEIIRADPELRGLFNDPEIVPSGGFYDRSHVRDDPCSRDVCLLIEFIRRRPAHGFAKQVVVNLSRKKIANPDFHTPDPAHRRSRLSAPGLE